MLPGGVDRQFSRAADLHPEIVDVAARVDASGAAATQGEGGGCGARVAVVITSG